MQIGAGILGDGISATPTTVPRIDLLPNGGDPMPGGLIGDPPGGGGDGGGGSGGGGGGGSGGGPYGLCPLSYQLKGNGLTPDAIAYPDPDTDPAIVFSDPAISTWDSVSAWIANPDLQPTWEMRIDSYDGAGLWRLTLDMGGGLTAVYLSAQGDAYCPVIGFVWILQSVSGGWNSSVAGSTFTVF